MLRESLHKLAPGAAPGNALAITPVPSGISILDQSLLLGGLPAGRMTEIAGPLSSGKTALGLRLLTEQTRSGQLVAVVDGTGQFYPPAAAAMGLSLPHTLLISPSSRPHCTDDEVLPLARAAEIITRSRAFSMVLLDLPHTAQLSRAPSRRLRVAAQATGTTILVLSTRAGRVEGAAARLEMSSPHKRHCISLRIAKGGRKQNMPISFPSRHHRFDSLPPSAVAPVQHRALPGQESTSRVTP